MLIVCKMQSDDVAHEMSARNNRGIILFYASFEQDIASQIERRFRLPPGQVNVIPYLYFIALDSIK